MIFREGFMARAYSFDLRSRVLDAIDSGLSTHKAAKRFSIGVASAVRWHRAWRDHGERVARKQGPKGGGKLDEHAGFIFDLLKEHPDITLVEIGERLAAERAISAVASTIWLFFDRRDITFKKRPHTRPNRNGRM
jgi:transposase